MSRLKEDLSSFPSTASTSQEDHENNSGSTTSRKLKVTLLSSEWRSTKGGLSTINRELAIQLAKHPSVEVSVYLPQCSEEDKRVSASHNVQLIEAEEMPGLEPALWLSCLPEDHSVDCVIGHGAVFGRQVQIIKRHHHCKWIQVVHTAPEELGMYKSYADAISRGEKKHQAEVKLCEKADQVLAVGPKLAEAFSGYLRACGKDRDVLNLTPGIFSEFGDVKQATEERRTFSVLVFGRGDNEDFQLKGYDIAARAIAKLKDEPQPYKLLFVGAPSGEEEKVADLLLEQGIDRSQLTVRCFDESREQLARLFCEVDLAIMPSRTEGFGLAALEALSAGLPVLVSENSGLGEALKKVSFGSYCVVKSEDPEAWASAIRIIREKDREMRLDESKTLREKYAIKHNWQDHCNRLIEIMRNISQGSSEGVQPMKKGKRPLPPSDVPDPKQPRLPRDEEESCPPAPVDCRKDCVSDNQCVAEEGQAHGHSVSSAKNLDIRLDCEQEGASSTQNVSGNLSSQAVLNVIANKYLQVVPLSNREELNGFLQYMQEMRKVIVDDVKMGSLIITVRCTSLRILDELWKDYCTGHLQDVAQRYLVTEDILQQLGLDSVQLTLTISEEEYMAYRKNFLKNEGIVEPVANTSLPDDLPLDAIKTEGEQSLPTDATPSKFSQDWSPPYKASTSQEGQENSSSSPSSKELRAVFLKGSKEGKRPLTSSSTLASKSPKTVGGEGIVEPVASTSLPDDLPLHAIKTEGEQTLPSDAAPTKFSQDLSPPCKASTSQEGQGNSSSSPSSKELRAISLKGWDSFVLVKLLRNEYKRRSLLRPLLWNSTIQLPIEQVYTSLKIVSRGKLAIQMEDDEEESDEEENDEVNVFDIFKVPDGGEDVMTIVEGSPGIGKTTFCLKLAYDWAHGNIPSECSFPKFEFVFLLKCRDINGDIMEAIREQLLPRDMEKLLHFMKNIHEQERLMLIILDGLDELPEQSRHHVDELLHRRILPFCFILATTRQERGIEVRKSVAFDIHLEIKGYTESDSIAYIRRHFETIDQSPKGEKLIEEMQQNTFLHALRSNPLNLLLLCVIYEDYKGKLPTSQTELYQVIVRCLLRRYCGKRNWPAPKDDSVLEKTFEKEILALGELAWLCLLSDRYGFFETELDEFERKYPGLKARELDLLYMEESLKRLNPQHEYCFLHKTFQEYVAAAYIAQKLRNQKFNVFKHLNISFDDIVTKYRQLFIFVSGMLGEKATVLFTQIGEELKKSYDWNWNERCNEKTATFFIQSFNESGHAEQMAVTLCNIIPFPKVITCKLIDHYNVSFIQVLMACRSFSNLRTPVELYADIHVGDRERRASNVVNYIESCPKLTIVSFRVHDLGSLTSSDADRLCKWFSASKNLSEFTLKYISHVSLKKYDLLVQIVPWLASCRTLTKVTFVLPGYAYNESFFNAFETGSTTLTSVNLVLWGSIKYTVTRALQHFLSNKSLNSLSLCIVGCVLDLLVAAVSQALTRQTGLKSLDLHLDGPLSSSSASFLEKRLMGNSSLNNIRLRVHGELPGNWHSVVENLRLAKKSPVCCSFYPNTFNNVANNDFLPVLVRKGLNVNQRLTVNVWGKMKREAAEALCEVLAPSSITVLTLNVRGNLTSEVSNSIARCLKENNTLSSLSINLWGELTTEGGIVPSSLSKNSRVQLNVHDVRIGPGESNNILVITTDNSAPLKVFFTNVKDRRKEKVSLTINNDSYVTKEWTGCLGDALSENPSLTTLDITVNSCVVDADLGENLGNSLLQSSSLTSLSLTFNFSNMKKGWECRLGERLIKMASLTSLSLELNGDGEENQKDCLSPTKLSEVLADIQSLSSLSVAIHSDSMCSFWDKVVGDCLIKCTSLEKLSFTWNGGKSDFRCLFFGLCNGLVRTSSLNTLCVAIFINEPNDRLLSSVSHGVNQGLSLNSSITTLTLTVTVAADETNDIIWLTSFDHGLSRNKSITTLNVTINECGNGESYIPEVLRRTGVFEGLVNNISVTTFNLTLSSSKEVSGDWLTDLSDTLMKNTSLTTLRLKVNNHCATGKSRLYDLSKLLVESRSLSLLELDVSFYGRESGCHKVLIQ